MAPQPIDFGILQQQTGGDRRLERDVLALFCAKAAADVDAIMTANSEDERRQAAHALVGSARAVGASEVARLAAIAEQGGGVDGAALREAVGAVSAFVEKVSAR